MSSRDVWTMTPEAADALRHAAEALASEAALHGPSRLMVVPAGEVVALFQALDVERARTAEAVAQLHAEGMRLQEARSYLARLRGLLARLVDSISDDHPGAFRDEGRTLQEARLEGEKA